MTRFTPGMKVTYTDAARKAWADAQVIPKLPEGDGTVVATPKPYLSVEGLVYVVWDSMPGKWTLTDENALQQVNARVLAERPKSLAELYMVMKWAISTGVTEDTLDFANKMGEDFTRMVAAGEDPNVARTDDEWDEVARRLHLWLGMDERA